MNDPRTSSAATILAGAAHQARPDLRPGARSPAVSRCPSWRSRTRAQPRGAVAEPLWPEPPRSACGGRRRFAGLRHRLRGSLSPRAFDSARTSPKLLRRGALWPLTGPAAASATPASASRTFAGSAPSSSRLGALAFLACALGGDVFALLALLVILLVRFDAGVRMGMGWPLAFGAALGTPSSAPPAPRAVASLFTFALGRAGAAVEAGEGSAAG